MNKDPLVQTGLKGRKDPQANKDHKVSKDLQVQTGFKDRKASQDPQVRMAFKVHRVNKGPQAWTVPKG